MGDHDVTNKVDEDRLREFTSSLLEDVQALELMLERGLFETGIRRIGAEQEFFLVDSSSEPSLTALKILDRIQDRRFTTELGQFNLEANLDPQEFRGNCLRRLEEELDELLEEISTVARHLGAHPLLVGILPTLQKEHLSLDSMTPHARYYQLDRVMRGLRGSDFRAHIKGLDELQTTHDNVMLEACNTSFQIHFQVSPDEFPRLYNLAQVVTGPVLAAAANSPVLLQHRLWHETRVALFTQSLDVRTEVHAQRGGLSRVAFGDKWVDDSILEIFREDIARFRVLLAAELDESPLKVLDRGDLPKLKALCLHNSTVYRWNRPCYGASNGTAHLRIENRALPAGPTVIDEVANAAFFFGLMSSLGDEIPDVREAFTFDDAQANFMAAARYGLGAHFKWVGGKVYSSGDLIRQELLPQARRGLEARGIPREDIERYLGVIEARVEVGQTGSQWILDSLQSMGKEGTTHGRYRKLTEALRNQQATKAPVHTWPLAEAGGVASSRASFRTVGQVMKTDLFTVSKEDLVDLAAHVMDWKHIRHVPVEDAEGRLVGLVSHRRLLREAFRKGQDPTSIVVERVMRTDPVTVSPETTTREAIDIMRRERVGCLPVVKDEKLVGIVTEHDFVTVAAELLDLWLEGESD